jgi:hypothetical protein
MASVMLGVHMSGSRQRTGSKGIRATKGEVTSACAHAEASSRTAQ